MSSPTLLEEMVVYNVIRQLSADIEHHIRKSPFFPMKLSWYEVPTITDIEISIEIRMCENEYYEETN